MEFADPSVYLCACKAETVPLLTTYGLRKHGNWAWTLALILAVVWIGWIALEIYLFGHLPIMLMWLVPQLLALFFMVRPSVKEYFKTAAIAKS